MILLRMVLLLIPIAFGAQDAFISSESYAKHNTCHCCMCNSCSGGCYCPGTTPCCRYCRSEDSNSYQEYALLQIGTVQIRRTAYPLPVKALNADVMQTIPVLIHGHKSVGYIAGMQAEHAMDHSKYGCHSSEY
jgi:hypothetical protein